MVHERLRCSNVEATLPAFQTCSQSSSEYPASITVLVGTISCLFQTRSFSRIFGISVLLQLYEEIILLMALGPMRSHLCGSLTTIYDCFIIFQVLGTWAWWMLTNGRKTDRSRATGNTKRRMQRNKWSTPFDCKPSPIISMTTAGLRVLSTFLLAFVCVYG